MIKLIAILLKEQVRIVLPKKRKVLDQFLIFFFCIILLCSYYIVVSKPKPTPNASSTAAHPALMHPLAAGRKY